MQSPESGFNEQWERTAERERGFERPGQADYEQLTSMINKLEQAGLHEFAASLNEQIINYCLSITELKEGLGSDHRRTVEHDLLMGYLKTAVLNLEALHTAKQSGKKFTGKLVRRPKEFNVTANDCKDLDAQHLCDMLSDRYIVTKWATNIGDYLGSFKEEPDL